MADTAGRAGGALVAALEELGPVRGASEAAVRDVLRQHAAAASSEAGAAEVLGLVVGAPQGDSGAAGWDAEVVVSALRSASPQLDWHHVAAALDYPGFAVPDGASFARLAAAFRRALPSDGFPVAVALSRVWTNAAGQLSLLRHATAAPPDVVSWESAGRRQDPVEGLHAGKSPTGTPSGCWMCLDLYAVLAALARGGQAASVRQVLELPLKHCPEVLLLGLASVREGWGPLQAEVCEALAVTYVASHPNSAVVQQRLWPLNRELVLRAMVALYAKDATNISRVLDVAQDLKCLTLVLDSTPAPFSIELAALASRREYLNLEKWLAEQFGAKGMPFMQATVAFLSSKLRDEQTAQPQGLAGALGSGKINLSLETLAIFLRVLGTSAGVLPADVLQHFKVVQTAALQQHPQLAGVVGDAGSLEAFAADIENEANTYFQRAYAGELSVGQLVDLLRGFKASSVPREQEVFACMVHSLFDEYRFFHNYPDKELHTTAVLFGALVHHGLVSNITLGIALRYVAEALALGPSNKMFRFATTAIRGFKDDLGQWPAYARTLAALDGLREADPELFAAVEAAAAAAAGGAQPLAGSQSEGGERGLGPPPGLGRPGEGGAGGAKAANGTEAAASGPPASEVTPQKAARPDGNAAGFPVNLPSTPSNPNMLFSTINAETLEQAAQNVDFPVPEEKVIDKVGFIMNNITMTNIDTKIRELNALVKPGLQPWFANYLVVKRAAQEPNFHAVYVAVAEKWNDKKLKDIFVRTTIHYLKVMLSSPMLKSSSSERTLLKNLGAFLGRLTVAKNRPVLQRDLDVKATILLAYKAGRMTAVLPFVRLLLEPCMDSKVFRPPNPWVMGILALLVEIYNLDGLKTGIKFEVELLLKSLNLSLGEVQPSTLLPGRPREMVNNMDFQPEKLLSQGGSSQPAAAAGQQAAGAAQGTPVKPGEPGAPPPPPPDGKPAPPPSPAPPPAPMIDPNVIANLHNFIVISPQLAVVGERLQLKRLVPMAVDRAIVEIISPVVDRSVTIACMTTQELVLKDYALEPDAEAVRRAAHQMVTGLAQSLALVTAKEPLRIAVGNNLRALLQAQLEATTLDQVVSLLVGDNLDLCCQVIEKAAAERAQREIDERLQPAYNARIRAKQAGQTQFADGAQLQGRFPGALPEALRPRPRQLTQQQQRVYDDFARIPRTAQAAAQQSAGPTRPPGSLPGAPGEGPEMGGVEGGEQAAAPGAPPAMPPAQAMPPTQLPPAQPDLRTRFLTWLQRMDMAIAKEPQGLLSAQPDGSELRALVGEVASIPNSELAALEVAKNIFAKLYQGVGSRLHVTAYAASLEMLREALGLRRLPIDLTTWFAQLPDETKFHKDVGEALVRGGLLYLPDLDLVLAKAMAGPRFQLAAELALHLVQQCVIVEPLLSGADLANTLDMLAKLAVRVSGGGSVLQLVEEARRLTLLRAGKPVPASPSQAPPAAVAATPKAVEDQPPPALVESIMKLFDRWARLLEESPTEKVHKPFVQELHAGGLLKGDEMTDRFLRIMFQLAVQHCLRSEAQALAAQPPGAPRPAALNFVAVDACVRLMVCLVQQHGGGPSLFAKVLGIMATVLQRDAEERGGAFNGRPYFRMCMGFLAELSPADPADEAGWRYLQAMATFLYATRTLNVPSFAFPWLQLVSDKRFMPKLLMAPGHRGWPAYLQLIISQLRFLEPFLRNAELTDAVRLLYKGTLRVLLVLLHDFPEFLCEFHFHLCDVIPPSCIQMRNLVLSAFPRAMRLPDPFTPNLKVDMLPEISQPPRFVPDPDALLPAGLKAEVDAFLSGRAPPAFLLGLRSKLALAPQDALVCGTKYNVLLINALVFYLGIRAVEGWAPTPGTPPVMQTPSMEVFQHLLRDMDTEGRYLLINALANQLRYPNLHTHYFSCAMLFLFTEAGSELVQEQITRVLLERLIVNRPHPWGLLITFIELIKNPRYSFWSHAFTRVAPEIERLFESVARSCMGPQPMVGPAGAAGLKAAAQEDGHPQLAAPGLA